SNVTVSDTLPSGLTFVAATPSQGTYDSTTGLWSVGTVTTTTPLTLTIRATLTAPAARTNTATVSRADQFDPDTANNTASPVVTPQQPEQERQQADLIVVKTVNNPRPTVGRLVVFTIVIGNNGPSTATNVIVRDPFPPGLVVVDSGMLGRPTRKQRRRLRWPRAVFRVNSATPSQETYDPATGVWQVGTLTPGARAVLRVVALVPAVG